MASAIKVQSRRARLKSTWDGDWGFRVNRRIGATIWVSIYGALDRDKPFPPQFNCISIIVTADLLILDGIQCTKVQIFQ